MLEKISSFFKNVPTYFKKAGQSMKNWPLYKKFDCGFWSLTGVFLITLIIMFATYATSMNANVSGVLTAAAMGEQNTIAAIGLLFLIFLILSIFTLVIGIAWSKKKKGTK